MKPAIKDQRRWLAYCDRELNKPDLHPARRELIEEKRAFLARQLTGRCKLCGREIYADESLATGIGSTCRHKKFDAFLADCVRDSVEGR